jgi:hypothetical protein
VAQEVIKSRSRLQEKVKAIDMKAAYTALRGYFHINEADVVETLEK